MKEILENVVQGLHLCDLITAFHIVINKAWFRRGKIILVFMKIIVPVDAYHFIHMASKEYFDFKNIQVIIYYPSSHLGFPFEFLFVLDVFFFLISV